MQNYHGNSPPTYFRIEEYIVITFLLEFPVAGLENLHTGKSFYIGGPEQYYCMVYFVASYKSLNLKFCVKLYIYFETNVLAY